MEQMVGGFISDLELLSRKENVSTVMRVAGLGRLWALVSTAWCCVCLPGNECGSDHTLAHLSSPRSISELISQGMEVG